MNKRVRFSLGVATAFLLAAASASAQSGVITSCVSKLTGVSRIVPVASACNANSESVVTWNQQGPAGAPGAPGMNGFNGTNGTNGSNGTNGASLLEGPPAPSAGQGSNGDTYLALVTGDLYRKANNVWTLIGNVRGPQGVPGQPGSAGDVGPQGPSGPTGPQGPQGLVSANGFITSASVSAPYIDLNNPLSFYPDTWYFDPTSPPFSIPAARQNETKLVSVNTVPSADNSFVVPAACLLSSLKVASSTSNGTGISNTIKVYRNEAPTTMGCQINGTTSCSDTVHTQQLSPGDRLEISLYPNQNLAPTRLSITLMCQ